MEGWLYFTLSFYVKCVGHVLYCSCAVFKLLFFFYVQALLISMKNLTTFCEAVMQFSPAPSLCLALHLNRLVGMLPVLLHICLHCCWSV